MSCKLFGSLTSTLCSKFNRLRKFDIISFVIYLFGDSSEVKTIDNNLMHLIKSKDLAKISQLIKIWPESGAHKSSLVINQCIDSQGYDVLNYLLSDKRIDVNCSLDPYGWTAFHRAVYNKDIALIVLLIKNEANMDVMDINGNTPFHILIQSSAQVSPTGSKSDFGPESHLSIVILKLMLNYCKSMRSDVINWANNFGKTPLHYAVVNNGADPNTTLSLISLLLESGSDPNSKDRLKRTPLYCAINERSFSDQLKQKIIDTLIQYDCDPLNLYELRQFGAGFTLKQISRTCLLRSGSLDSRNCFESLPKELKSYLNIELIELKKDIKDIKTH